MTYKEITEWAKAIAKDQRFEIEGEIYHGIYYQKNHVRNIIYKGTFDNRPAILKAYNDPRFTDEPASLQAFLNHNKSKLLLAPQLYASEQIDDHQGWLIMEYLDQGMFLSTPIPKEQRARVLELFTEYKQYFPKTPHRKLSEMEQDDSFVYTKKKFDLWHADFLQREEERKTKQQTQFNSTDFELLYKQAIDYIKQQFSGVPLEWVHGHFKPQELFEKENGTYYLTDFAHSKMVPLGYELAFIIWADQIMSQPVSTPYPEWKQGIDEWIQLIIPYLNIIQMTQAQFQAAIIERLIGTLLRDFGSSDKPAKDIEQMFKLATTYIKEAIQ